MGNFQGLLTFLRGPATQSFLDLSVSGHFQSFILLFPFLLLPLLPLLFLPRGLLAAPAARSHAEPTADQAGGQPAPRGLPPKPSALCCPWALQVTGPAPRSMVSCSFLRQEPEVLRGPCQGRPQHKGRFSCHCPRQAWAGGRARRTVWQSSTFLQRILFTSLSWKSSRRPCLYLQSDRDRQGRRRSPQNRFPRGSECGGGRSYSVSGVLTPCDGPVTSSSTPEWAQVPVEPVVREGLLDGPSLWADAATQAGSPPPARLFLASV